MATTLRTGGDDMHAFSDPQSVAHWNNTQWLLEYAENNIEWNDGKWSDWSCGEDLRTTYEDDRGEVDEYGRSPGGYVEVGPRGLAILDAAVRGEDYETLMDEWNEDIYEDANS